MSTATTIIQDAMRIATVLRKGFSMTADEGEYGIRQINHILEAMAAKGVEVPSRTRESFSPAASQSSYTIGTGGDFNTTRPISIEAITETVGGVDYNLVSADLAQYNAAGVKTYSGVSDYYYYEPAYPLGKIFFEYQPLTSYTITIDSLKPLTAIADLTDSFSLPEAFENYIMLKLAKRFSMKSGRQLSADVVTDLDEAESVIDAMVITQRPNYRRTDPALRQRAGTYNILKG